MAWTFCTSGAAVAKAGNNVSTTIKASGAWLADWSDQVEGSINAESKYDYLTNFATMNANYKQALAEAASSMIGNKLIMWDMSGFTSRFEATTMLDINHDMLTRNLKFLKTRTTQEEIV
jgi:hypothetical protein